ncbi:MAG: hypothetical protein ACREQV_12095 [Candidatus Binatia bacterium]
MSALEDYHDAAKQLGQHPQDHGWREFYTLVAYGLQESVPELVSILTKFRELRPSSGASHTITLLGIALKATLAEENFRAILAPGTPVERLRGLAKELAVNEADVAGIMTSRQNSFTSARRFLVAQVVLSSVFGALAGQQANFADLGTGLGLMPRQINSQRCYERFAPDLRWPSGTPKFRPIPINKRFGVDRKPMPDLDWVRTCYGLSPYYNELLGELLSSLEEADVRSAQVSLAELDLLNIGMIRSFIRKEAINSVNLSYVLYELNGDLRGQILDVLISELKSPGLIIVAEPNSELTQQGCSISLYLDNDPCPLELCTVSDGHFRGTVFPGADFGLFQSRFPIS